MPSSRRLKVTGLVAILTVCIIFYITHGAKSTHNNPFYTRTVQAINDRQAAASREEVIAEEKQRLERVERLHREHDIAISAAQAEATGAAAHTLKAEASAQRQRQKPIGHEESTTKSVTEGGKPVAGRKMMGDGKVVHSKPSEDGDDGVAKVGNVGPQSSHAAKGDQDKTEEDEKIEAELNNILRKGPIIIFSKSYCPFSKKAKHILLDLYTISPPPYVVELDQHDMGTGLQAALERTTGRRTVPNVLINGKSIGGGDDIEELHESGKVESTISSYGGKRIMKVEKRPQEEVEEAEAGKREMRFKA